MPGLESVAEEEPKDKGARGQGTERETQPSNNLPSSSCECRLWKQEYSYR
jgi:hypothetical protein